MENRLSSYIWKHTKRQQLYILLVVAVSMIPYFMSFDLPKQIVNGPIQGKGFDTPGATQLFMHLSLDLPYFGTLTLFPGVELERMSMLYALSAVFLVLVIINGLFKYYINTYKGRLGERLLRRIRFELVDKILRFPPNQFKRVKGAEIASMVKDEVEPLGGFTGDAFVSPALLGGQALTALFFILVQNLWLGLIAAGMVAVQGFIIPRMRRRLLVLGRERQLTARELSGRVSEIFEGIGTIRAYDTTNYERADIAARLGRIFKIRYDLYNWKFLVKFINNFLASLTPFFFYCVGGFLALNGQLDIGQLVAVIGAYKDLPGPLKDLIDWDQIRQDVQVKYVQVVEQFSVEDMIAPEIQALRTEPNEISDAALAAANLSLVDDSGARLVSGVSVHIDPGETVAIVGTAASGGEAVAESFARIIWPESGRIAFGGEDIMTLPESITGRQISYASSESYFFHGTLRDNLIYGLKHAPLREAAYDEAGTRQRKWEINEARLAGNPSFDVNSDWIDYNAAGATGPGDLSRSVTAALDAVLLSKDILDLAMRSIVDPANHENFAARIVEMRRALRTELEEEGLNTLVVSFEPGAYNTEATVGENLLFGTAIGPALMGRAIANNRYFLSVVSRTSLDRILYEMGLEIAENAVNLFGDLPPDHPFFQQLTFMSPDDLPQYQILLQKLKGRRFEDVAAEDRVQIIRLSFLYIEPRHRFGLLTDELMQKIIDVRREFHEGLPAELAGAIERYDPNRYMAAASLLDNVLLGRISHKHPDGSERIRSIVRKLLVELGLYDSVLDIGLEFNIGAGGRRLTSAQRQKLNVARALVRRAPFYIFNRPLSALDGRVQEQVLKNVLDMLRDREPHPAIIWVLSDTTQSNLFDRVVVFDKGRLAEDGTHATLLEKNGVFSELVS
jgi:putative ABC transport system ATP-binding protein